jgi:low molecular weight protein-tyrosine phosphatase
MVRICFVCLGNICRSPTAHGIMAHMVAEAGLADRVSVESAGTGGWHVGESPDPRTVAAARRRGVALRSVARQFGRGDFARCDLVLAMDGRNHRDLLAMAPDAAARAKVRLFRSFDPAAPAAAEVPDPYYGGADGFDQVYDVCAAACRGLLAHVQSMLAERRP